MQLWLAYCAFYETGAHLIDTDYTWTRLVGPEVTGGPRGLVAVQDDRIVGFTNFLFHASTWSRADYCYLEDLFVSPDARRYGVAAALISAVYRAADAAGASRVYWITRCDNASARSLYDKLATVAPIVQYRRIEPCTAR